MTRWTRNETLLALDLYLVTPFGKQHRRHPPIVQLAEKIGRTASSIAMKLNNFTSLDPSERERGIVGLSNASRLDREIWEQYENETENVVSEIEQLRYATYGDPDKSVPETEALAPTTVRLQQGFFRRIVLATYESTCCITGIPVADLLRASHIVPWSESQQERLNPRNGLCLVATFDAAFDRGLIWFDDEFQMQVSPRLEDYEDNSEVRDVFLTRVGSRLRLPEKNLPDPKLLKWHRKNVVKLG